MRVGTWNCRYDIDGKREHLARLGLDVAVIPESAASPMLAGEPGVAHTWIGSNRHKGLGVFGFGGWTVEPIPEPDPFPWCLPVRARRPDGFAFTLLAVWVVKRTGDGRPSYPKQFTAVIERWAPQIADGEVVIAGDMNASLQGPAIPAHRKNLERLADLGMDSAFQLVNGPVHPDDEPPTLRWMGKGRVPKYFHCDFVFVSRSLRLFLRGATVGPVSEWIESGLSDHCPVTAEFAVRGQR